MSEALRNRLPRYTGVTSDPQTLAETVRDVIHFLERLPELELVTFTHNGVFPLNLKTQVQNPKLVVFNGQETNNPAATVELKLPTWIRGRTAGQITVTGCDGLTAGTTYTITAFVIGA